MLGGYHAVNDDVSHSLNQVLFDVNTILGELLVKVFLKLVEADGVACLVETEGFLLFVLKADVGEMYFDVF